MSRVRRRQGLAAWRKALHLRMRRLRQADLGDGRHDHAWFEAAFARLVLGRLSHGHPFEWDFGAAIAKTARARLLQVGVAAVRQAAPRHGCAGPRAARRPRRGRRGRDPVADQGRSGLRRRRPLAPGQNVGRRRRRSRKRRPRTPSPGRDQGLLRRLAAWLRRRQRRPGRDDQNRRLAVLRPRPRRPARAPCRRRHGRPRRSALGPPRLLQRQDLGARRLPRTAKTASPELPRRIRLPLQPTPNPPRRLPLPLRKRPRPKAANLQHVDHAGSSGISLWLLFRNSARLLLQKGYSSIVYKCTPSIFLRAPDDALLSALLRSGKIIQNDLWSVSIFSENNSARKLWSYEIRRGKRKGLV